VYKIFSKFVWVFMVVCLEFLILLLFGRVLYSVGLIIALG